MSAHHEVSFTTKNTASLVAGILSTLFGIVALLVTWIPYLGVFGLPAAGIGIILALFGCIAALMKGKGWGLPMLGGAICLTAFLLFVASTSGANAVIKEVAKANQQQAAAEEPAQQTAPSEPTPKVEAASEPKAETKVEAVQKPAQFEPIEGAFGIKLGDKFDVASAETIGKLTDGTPLYAFTPANPFRSFTRYSVQVTPVSHRVCAVWADGKFNESDEAKKERDLVLKLLVGKYGPEAKNRITFSDVKRIQSGDRYVMLSTPVVFGGGKLEVRYVDEALEKQAEKERLDAEVKKVNASGL
jgi:hypothetical protein